MTATGVAIRRAGIPDATALSRLMEQTFRDAFGAANRAEDLALHVRRSYSPAIQRRELADPDLTALVAELDNRLAGYVQLRSGEVPPEVTGPDPLQLWRFYVEQSWHGRGVAQVLMEAAKDAARDRGARTLWLGVWEENPRGIAFYRKVGFREVGYFAFQLGEADQRDLIMVHDLD